MDFRHFLLWIAVTGSAALLLQALRLGRRWVAIKAFATLTTSGLLWVTAPDLAGPVGGALLFLLLLLPLLGVNLASFFLARDRTGLATWAARLVRWLHPFDGFEGLPALMRALDLAQRGESEMVFALLRPRADPATEAGRQALSMLLRLQSRWDELVELVERDPKALARDPNLLALYLRALGEIGEPARLLAVLEDHRASIERLGATLHRAHCRLFALAFSGRVEAVQRLFAHRLAHLPPPLQRFWLATAAWARGDLEPARAALEALGRDASPMAFTAIGWRLAHPLPRADQVLGPTAWATLEDIERRALQEERFGEISFARRLRAWSTWVLTGVHLAVFAAEEALGGSTDPDTLLGMGALWTRAVVAGEWWRIGTAFALHWGPLHLFVNLLGLWLLGPYLEFHLGWRRYLGVYLGSGVGSMGFIAGCYWLGMCPEHVALGASGGVMGLVGATTAVMLEGSLREQASLAWRRLGFLSLIAFLQVAFDLWIPESSLTGHLGGLVLGFSLGLILERRP